jgi:hypothetical protein
MRAVHRTLEITYGLRLANGGDVRPAPFGGREMSEEAVKLVTGAKADRRNISYALVRLCEDRIIERASEADRARKRAATYSPGPGTTVAL